MNQYKIHYRVDTGWEYLIDTAIVKANNEEEAIEKLKSYISSIDNEYYITSVFSIEEFTEEIFSYNFVPSNRKK